MKTRDEVYKIAESIWVKHNGWGLTYWELVQLSYVENGLDVLGHKIPEDGGDVVYNPTGDPDSNHVLTRFMVNELCREWRSWASGFLAAYEHLEGVS